VKNRFKNYKGKTDLRHHDYAARIDYELWNDLIRVKELDAATTSINALLNEGCKLIRDKKMQELVAQRKQRTSLESMSSW
jgi:hypothetical protein